MDPTEITSTIVQTAQQPASASNKAESATAQNPVGLTQVDAYLRKQGAADACAAAGNPFGAIQFVHVCLPGACR